MLRRRSFNVGYAILCIPFVLMIFLSFKSGNSFASLDGFREIFSWVRVHELTAIICRSLLVCSISTLVAYVISLVLVKTTSTVFQSFFFILITLPFLLNETVRVFSWQYLLSENGLFNQLLSFCLRRQVSLFNGTNSSNVYAVMIFTCVPFGIFINAAAIKTVPGVYYTVASDLKVPVIAKFLKITLPLTRVASISSLIVTFFISFSLSSEINYLGGDTKMSIRNLITSLLSASKFHAVFALGTTLFAFLATLIMFFRPLIFSRQNL